MRMFMAMRLTRLSEKMPRRRSVISKTFVHEHEYDDSKRASHAEHEFRHGLYLSTLFILQSDCSVKKNGPKAVSPFTP